MVRCQYSGLDFFRISYYVIGMDAKLGRPARDPKGNPAQIVPIRMTQDERNAYQRAAGKAKLSLSEWARDRLTRAAKRESQRN